MARRRRSSTATPHRGGQGGQPRPAAAPTEAPRPTRRALLPLLAAAAAVIALWAGLRLVAPQPWSYDEYYHLAVARELRSEPLLRSFPWTPHSVLAEHWADKEPLFHFAITPFAGLPLERAGFF